MEKLINRSYQALIDRNKIIPNKTNTADFILKMGEELKEIESAYLKEGEQRTFEEIRQLMTVCIMCLHHNAFNPLDEFEKEVILNEYRAIHNK